MKDNYFVNLNFVVLDIVTTGNNPEFSDIIKIEATYYKDNKENDTFLVVVKPEYDIPDYVLQLNKISIEELKKGMSPQKAFMLFKEFIRGKVLVCYNLEHQIHFINFKCKKMKIRNINNKVFDVNELAKIYFPTISNDNIKIISEIFNIELEEKNKNVKLIYHIFVKFTKFIRDKIPLDVNNEILSVLQIAEDYNSNKELLEYIVDEQRKFALLDIDKFNNSYYKTKVNYIDYYPDKIEVLDTKNIFKDDGIFSSFPNYEKREEQIEMTLAIENSFNNNSFLLAEAGTGVGKSFAYLVPSIKFSYKEKEKIVITTNTKNLQEQLFFKDIPILKELLKIPFRAVLLKGRDNYICKKRWQEIFFDLENNTSVYDAGYLAYLVLWYKITTTGDITENNSFDKKKSGGIWKKLVADRHHCSGKKCQFYSSCFVMDIRKKSDNADLIVVNHSLLFADLLNENRSIGKYNYLVVDEAHNLPDIAASNLGFSLSFSDINQLFQYIFSNKGELQRGVIAQFKAGYKRSMIDEKSTAFFDVNVEKIEKFINTEIEFFKSFFLKLNNCIVDDANLYGKYRIKTLEQIENFKEDLIKCKKIIYDIGELIASIHLKLSEINNQIFVGYENNLTNLEGLEEYIQEIYYQFSKLLDSNLSENVLWISSLSIKDDKYPKGVLNFAPLEVNTLLNDILYDNVNSIIFTSATIAIRGKFKYFSERMGLNLVKKKLEEIIVKSPFDYNVQTKVLATPFLPIPSDKFFLPQSSQILREIVFNSEANTMVLFTSYKDMNNVYKEIHNDYFQKDILLLSQGKSIGRTAMIEEFKNNKKCVLLGTSSFWEGVDIKGDSLSLLVIYKLPFSVPSDPIVESLLEKMEKEGKNSFMHYMIPNALIKFRQGLGRLIRSKNDSGIILILDQRIVTKKYGKYFQQIIPTKCHFPQTNIELQDIIREWYRKIKF